MGGEGWPGVEADPRELNRSSPGVLLAWKEETSSLGESCEEWEGPDDGWTGQGPRSAQQCDQGAAGHSAREWGEWGGVTAAATELRARDGALPQSHSLTLTHTNALALTEGHPARGERNCPGRWTTGQWGRGLGWDTGRLSRTGRRRYLCQGELGRRSHGVSIMHGRGRKDRLTGARGGEEAEGAVRGEARAGGRASPLTSTTSLLSPAPPRPAWPRPPGASAAVPKSWRRILRCRTGSYPQGRLRKTGTDIAVRRTGCVGIGDYRLL